MKSGLKIENNSINVKYLSMSSMKDVTYEDVCFLHLSVSNGVGDIIYLVLCGVIAI